MENNIPELYVNSNGSKSTIYDKVAKYIYNKYDIFYNEISHDFQISIKSKNEWKYLNIYSLIIELSKAEIDISPHKLEIFIKSNMIPKYNPIESYFSSLPVWDGYDYIKKLTLRLKIIY